MFRCSRRTGAIPVLTLGLIASWVSGPAHAAQTTAPVKTYSVDQLLTTLPASTPILFHGKPVTLATLRAAHQALLARFQSVDALKALLTFGPAIDVPVRGALAAPPALPSPAGKAPASPTSPPPHHVPNPAPAGPYDYVAACKDHSVCVYVPGVPSADGIAFSGDRSYFQEYDPLLTPSACGQYGGIMYPGDFSAAVQDGSIAVGPGQTQLPIAACEFLYPTSAHASAFAGNPPAMKAAVANICSNGFHVDLDPLGAAQVTAPPSLFSTLHILPMACAVDVYVPSS